MGNLLLIINILAQDKSMASLFTSLFKKGSSENLLRKGFIENCIFGVIKRLDDYSSMASATLKGFDKILWVLAVFGKNRNF